MLIETRPESHCLEAQYQKANVIKIGPEFQCSKDKIRVAILKG